MELEIGGRRYVVNVRREGAGTVVAVDGVEMAVDIVRSGGGWSLLLGNAPSAAPPHVATPRPASLAAAPPSSPDAARPPAVSRLDARRSYDVSVDRRSPGELAVFVNGVAVRVDVTSRRGRAKAGGESGQGAQMVTAPMPGRVVKVLVEVGDSVQAGQPVVVVEAMKMENELRAARAGTVAEVRATQGMLVEARAVLLVVDSAEEVLPQES